MENVSLAVTSAVGSSNSALVDYAQLPDYGRFVAYDAQLPIADINGTRIVKCLYKATKKDGKLVPSKFTNSYVRVPVRHLSANVIKENIDKLLPHIELYLQSIEDGIIKEMHKKGSLNVYVNALSLDSIIAELEESNDSGRLNADKLNAWFDDCIADNLTVQFAEKLGIDKDSSEEELQKLQVIIGAYKAKFASLAGGKTSLPESDVKALLNVLTKCDESDSFLSAKVKTRLENMNKKDEDLLLAL